MGDIKKIHIRILEMRILSSEIKRKIRLDEIIDIIFLKKGKNKKRGNVVKK